MQEFNGESFQNYSWIQELERANFTYYFQNMESPPQNTVIRRL